MLLELNISTITDLITFSSAFMLGVLFMISKSENKKANVFLSLFLISLALEVLDVLSESITGLSIGVVQTSLFTLPFLMFYVLSTINHRLKRRHWLILIPGLFSNVVDGLDHLTWMEYLFNIAILIIIWRILNGHENQLSNYYSDLEHKSLKWIRMIVLLFAAFHLLWILEEVVGIANENVVGYFASLSTFGTFFMILWIGHFGFSQQEVFKSRLFVIPQPNTTAVEEKENAVDNNEVELFEKLQAEVENRRLFANSRLNLRSLSIELGVNEKVLSRLINAHAQCNFYVFINQFRVNEFKRLLQSDKASQYSLLGLAEEAGFNSKSTFYAAFKSIEGIPPKQYEQSLNESEWKDSDYKR